MITRRRWACAVVLENSATTPGRMSNVKTSDPNLRKYFPFMIHPPCSLLIKTQEQHRELNPKLKRSCGKFCDHITHESRDQSRGFHLTYCSLLTAYCFSIV